VIFSHGYLLALLPAHHRSTSKCMVSFVFTSLAVLKGGDLKPWIQAYYKGLGRFLRSFQVFLLVCAL
jgi:hypothetical protein